MTWYAIQYRPSQGERALHHLQNQQIHCFYPKVRVENIRGGKRATKLEPLFPGYIFINLEKSDPQWAKLRSTRGVLRVVRFAQKPAAIADDVIEHVKASLEVVEEQGGIQSGQSVRLSEGAFEGLDAVFQAYDGEERAVVLINFMQKQQRLKVPVSSLRT